MPELERKKSFTSYKSIVTAWLLILLMVAMSGGIRFYWPEFDDTRHQKSK
jgi:hypothetical protein